MEDNTMPTTEYDQLNEHPGEKDDEQVKMFETLPPTRLFVRCAFPNMVSMAVMSLYTIVDGIFVGQFIGAEALAAVNRVMPLASICFALSDMIAVGSSVQVAIHLGEKKYQDAGRIFTFSSLLIIGISVIIGIIGFFGAEKFIKLMGADETLTAMGAEYLKVFAIFAPVVLVYFAVDNYLRTCGRPKYSMVLNVITSVLNIILDILFLGVFHWGIGAAALASCISISLGTVIGFIPFICKKLPLRFTPGIISKKLFANILFNGSSEFFSNIAGSILMVLINAILLHLGGTVAVAAFSVVMYVDVIVISLLYGMTDSMQPAISYCYGAKMRKRMFSFEKHILVAGAIISISAFFIIRGFGSEILSLFVRDETPELLEMSIEAIKLYTFTYFLLWIDVALSAFFTAVNKPGISLAISLGRSLFFPLAVIFILVHFLGLNGVWLTAVVANLLTAVTAIAFLIRFIKQESLQRSQML